MYRRILVPVDGSVFAEAALPRAVALATRWQAALELATVANVPVAESSSVAQADALERVKQYAATYLATVESRIRDAGFDGELHTEVIPSGDVPRALLEHAGHRGADFASMTTHGRGPLRRAWLGSTADSLVRRSPIPILLVRPEEEQKPPELPTDAASFRRILVPLDGSEAAEKALDNALPLVADEGGAELILVRVVLDASLPGASPYLPHMLRESEEHREVEAGALKYLEEVASRIGGRVGDATVSTRVVTAPGASTGILDALGEAQADAVALTTEGRGGAARLFLGSVADKVIRSATVPVLVCRCR